jgi:hypothetical protein
MQSWVDTQGAESVDDAPVTRILVASQSCVPHSVFQEMERIRSSALRHNVPVGVSTALLFQSGWFVQWKEGPANAVDHVMERVAADARHFDLRFMHRSRGPRLLGGPWSMGIVHCRETPAHMQERVERLTEQEAEEGPLSPAAILRRLSKPTNHPGTLRQDDPDAFQRVLVCAAAGVASFELVDWLGQCHHAEVVRRRFAGAKQLDVGSDYVDVDQGERVCRVIAMARHGLHLPLTRAFLPDYSHVVLLLSTDAERNVQLMDRVLTAFECVPHPPIVLGVGARPGLHASPAALARRFGLPYLSVLTPARGPQETWEAIEPLLGPWPEAANGPDVSLWQAPLFALGQ